ncbi:MAG: hypothetical protein CVU59_09805 [Deltaproteobacteria bacterium HGW-Deltaproteobacteria-17]|nr:MAG: hypothetical protein CVU59_09805 [Deltaproteobacteria bacterium HGW-Deltaproteobacteria-17]
MRSGLFAIVLCTAFCSGACSLLVSFDEPGEPACNMMPPDCSLASCLGKPECAWQECNPAIVYYDSPPSCDQDQECVYSESDGVTCLADFFFSEGNFYGLCDQNRCPHGGVCIQGMPGSPSVCVPYCNVTSHPRCPDRGICYNTEDSALIDVCFRSDGCDPVKNRGCDSGLGCYMIFNNETSCLPAGPQLANDRCKIAWDCAGGHVCSEIVAGETYGRCIKVCQDQTQCAMSESCVLIGTYGLCQGAVPVK